MRVILKPPADQSSESQAVLDDLVTLGASYEGMHPGYLAIDIPPDVQLERIVEYLTASGRQWEHADPRYSELYPDEQDESDAARG